MSDYYKGKYVQVRGPLAGLAEGFAEVLWERGYSARSVDSQMRMVRDFSGWLEDRDVPVDALDDVVVDAYASQRRLRTKTLRSPLALVPLLGFLVNVGAVPPRRPKAVAE